MGEKIKRFEVKIYFSSFCTYQLDAKSSVEAILKARRSKIDDLEILTNLENWEEADEAEIVML